MKNNNRTVWIINKNFQYKFILMSILPMIITVIFFWLCVELAFYNMIEFGEELGLAADHTFYSLLKTQKFQMMIILLITLAISMVFYITWAVFYSNRIAGPLCRLKNYLTSLKKDDQGNYPRLAFRDKDYFGEIPEEFNRFLEKLEKEDKPKL